jgi:hypothetical protein
MFGQFFFILLHLFVLNSIITVSLCYFFQLFNHLNLFKMPDTDSNARKFSSSFCVSEVDRGIIPILY